MKTLKLCFSILFLSLIAPAIGYGQCNWTLTTTDATCGNNNGSISITATACRPVNGFTVYKNGGLPYMTMQNPMTNLGPGTYNIYTADWMGNLIYVGTAFIGSSTLSTSINTTDNTCPGACAGTATVSVSSNSPVSYAWSSTSATTSSLNNLCNGNYTVTITNNMGCQTIENFSIITNYALNMSWQKTTFNQFSRNDVIKRTLLDANGNLYVMGEFEVESELEGHPLTTINPNQPNGIFVARYSYCGDLEWVSQLQNHGPIPFDVEAFDLDFDNNQTRIVVFGKWDNFDPGQEFTWNDGLGVDHTPANTGTNKDVFATEFNTADGEFTQNENFQLDFQDRLTTGKSENGFGTFFLGGQIQNQAKIERYIVSVTAPIQILTDNNSGNIVADFVLDNAGLVAAINLEQSSASIMGTAYGNQSFALMVRTSNTSMTIPSAVISSDGEASINDIDISSPGTSYPLIAVGTFRGAVPGWSTGNTNISSSITTALIAQFDLSNLTREGTYMVDGSISKASAEAVNVTQDVYVVTGWLDGDFAKVTGNNGMGTGNLSGPGIKSMWTTKFNGSNGDDQWFEGIVSQSHVIPYDVVFNFGTKEFYTGGSYKEDLNLPSSNNLHNPTPGQGNEDGFLVRGHSSQFSASYYKTTSTNNGATIRITDGTLDEAAFAIYPNPSNGNVTVDVTGLTDEPMTLKVYSITGQLLWSKTISPSNGSLHASLQLTQLKTGLYTMQLVQNDHMKNVKLIIE